MGHGKKYMRHYIKSVEDGRELEPSASIIDSQSVKTTEKGGLKVSTFINTLKDANATGGHNGVDYCWLVQLIFKIEMVQSWYLVR